MLFFNANFICYYFYPTKKREEPKEKQKESNKKILSAFLRLFFSEMLFAESIPCHLVEMAEL